MVLLTVFRKTRMREDAEVKHEPAHEEFVRTIEKGELDR
jgi:hypothetical protein